MSKEAYIFVKRKRVTCSLKTAYGKIYKTSNIKPRRDLSGSKETFKLIRSSKRTPVEATLGGNREEAFSKEKERTLTDHRSVERGQAKKSVGWMPWH